MKRANQASRKQDTADFEQVLLPPIEKVNCG